MFHCVCVYVCMYVYVSSARCQTCDWAFHKRVCRSKSSTVRDESSVKPTPGASTPSSKSDAGGLFSSLKSLSPSKRAASSVMAKFGGRKTTRGLSGLANLGDAMVILLTCVDSSSLFMSCVMYV